jgi:DNA-binding PadR family transcriptional regulator
VIELAILGVLKGSELHGYELKKQLRDVLGPLSSVSFGSLYPALARLEAAGHLKAVEAAEAAPLPAFPSTGSFAGEAAAFRAAKRRAVRGPRNRKVYGITDRGEARLAQLIADSSDDDRCFSLKLAFCRWCEPEVRLGLLQRRRAALVERLSEGRSTRTPAERLDRYVRSLMEHETESTERDIAWLDRLIEEEIAS